MKVLIVDDEEGICKWLQRELQKEGYEVDYTTSPVGVLEKLKEAKEKNKGYELLLLDFRLPRLNGFELLRQIREARLGLDVVIITGYGDEEKATEAIRLGAFDYLRKPISMDELRTAVFRVRQKRAGAEKKALKHHILVVDDEPDLCARIKRELDKEGYEVAVAYDGVEGLGYFKNNRVDAVIADIRMPRMEGLEMLDKCREITDDFVSIVITGYGDHETAIEALKLGAFDYLKKPISLDELITSVSKGIDVLGLRRGLAARKRELEIESELKEQYAKKIEREKNFSANIIATVPDSLLVLDKDLRIKSANRTFYETFQTEPKKVIGTCITDILPEDGKKLSSKLTNLFGTGDMLENFELHSQSEKLDERIFNIRARGIIEEEEEMLVIQDITRRKQAEEALRLFSEELELKVEERTKELRKAKGFSENIVTTVPDSLLVLDKDLRIKSANRSFYEKFQTEPEKVIGSGIADILGDNDGKLSAALTKLFGTEDMLEGFELHYQSEKLGEQIFNITARGMLVAEEEEEEELVVLEDITERKKAEEEVKKSRKFLDTIIENIPDPLYIKDRQFRFVEVNKAFCHTHKVTKGEILGEPRYRETDEKVFKCVKELEIPEQCYTDAEGNKHWTHLKKVPLTDDSGNITHVLTISRDITERKQAEDQIKASLKEKEVLLREIHHRVKNNLQIISSLLNMQARKATDKNVIVSLLDSRSRIHTMSLIHAQLYQSENLERIEMDVTIRKLVSFLSQMYAGDKKNIESVVTANGVILSISLAIPCGLIINELVSNALKHAFKGMAEGSIEVSMRESAGDRIKLTVKDNGIGIPEELDVYKTDTLGLKIVRTLAEEQLSGKMGLIRNEGAEIYVQFDKSITN